MTRPQMQNLIKLPHVSERLKHIIQSQFWIIPMMLFLCSSSSFGQEVSGKLTNQNGAPVPFVTIVAPTVDKGTTSNADGTWKLKLPPGKHRILFQAIDYEKEERTVDIVSDAVELNVVLKEQSYQLPELTVSRSREDPACAVMRQAMARTTFHRKQVLEYTAKVYIKGSGKLEESPMIFKPIIGKQGIEIGKTYVTESVNEVFFRQPSEYRERCISLRSSMPFKGGPEPMRMFRRSWYDDFPDDVNPLSTQAFSVYRFKLVGTFYENGMEINRIEVTPKRKGPDVYSGMICIVEKLWCIHSLSLTRTENGMNVTLSTVFRPRPDHPDVWLPASHIFTASGDYLGVKGFFRYVSSVRDYHIKLNPLFATSTPVMKEAVVQKQVSTTRNQKRIEALQQKSNLTKREMIELASKYQRESDKALRKEELKPDSSGIVVDSLAMARDSSFWEQQRSIPLLEEEHRSFDSIKPYFSSPKQYRKPSAISLLLQRNRLGSPGKPEYWMTTGILVQPRYNAVEGLCIRPSVYYNNGKAKPYSVSLSINILPERMSLPATVTQSYSFSPQHNGSISLEFGTAITDFNAQGIGPIADAVQLLLLQHSYSRWYQQDFLRLSFQHDLTRNLQLFLSAGTSRRYAMENLKRYQGTLDEVRPSNKAYDNLEMPTYESHQVAASLQYQPFATYRIKNGRKLLRSNTGPVFTLSARQAFDNNPQFTRVGLSVQQEKQVRHWLLLQTRFSATWQDGNWIPQPDRIALPGNQSFFNAGNPVYRFQDMPYYLWNVQRGAVWQGFLTAECKRIFLRRLPYLNLPDYRESVYMNAVQTPFHQQIEAGYRVNKIFGMFFIGGNVCFRDNSAPGLSLQVGWTN